VCGSIPFLTADQLARSVVSPMQKQFRLQHHLRPGSNQPPDWSTAAWVWLLATLAGVLVASGLVAVTGFVVLPGLRMANGAPIQASWLRPPTWWSIQMAGRARRIWMIRPAWRWITAASQVHAIFYCRCWLFGLAIHAAATERELPLCSRRSRLLGACSEASCHSSGWKSRQHRSPVDAVVIPSMRRTGLPEFRQPIPCP